MKVTITVIKKTKTTEAVEIEFPVYYKHGDTFDSGGWYNVYCRLDANGRLHSVNEHNDHWEYKSEQTRIESNLGWMGDPDQYYYERSTAAEFYEKLDELKSVLAAIPGEGA